MPKLPRVSGAEALKALQKLGFEKVRQSGSHVITRRGEKGCVIPMCALLDQFSVIVAPSFRLIHKPHLRIQNLRRTYDLLLPRLLAARST